MRIGFVPTHANMGAHERHTQFPISPQYMDQTRYANVHLSRKTLTDVISGAAAFISAATKRLPASDVWCILYPSLKHFLRSDVREVDERSLLIAMKPSVSVGTIGGA